MSGSETMGGAVMHWQMLSKDPERIASFYAALFGWKVSARNGMGYRTIETGGGVNGGLWPVPPEAPEGVQIYVQVPDIDRALERLVELGGTVVMPKQVLPDGDAMALALDPLGRSFGLMTARA
jgi:predicted enzyme related to lactoylglutathione lyase